MYVACANDECDSPFNKLLNQREMAALVEEDMSTDLYFALIRCCSIKNRAAS